MALFAAGFRVRPPGTIGLRPVVLLQVLKRLTVSREPVAWLIMHEAFAIRDMRARSSAG